MALPTNTGIGVIGMPLTWEEQEHVTRLDGGLRTMGTLEDTLALRIIEQLVFVEYPTFLEIEIIAVGMSLGGIILPGGYLFIPHSTDGQAP
jgi:hypothetical protein